jgi:predicted alpha-1,2-mannosidase
LPAKYRQIDPSTSFKEVIEMKMRLVCLAGALLYSALISFAQSPADAVNPMVGTANEGYTYPGVGLPFGMTQWTPATRDSEAKAILPYFYNDTVFRGIRGSHFLSGSATQDYGSFQLLAGSGSFAWNGHLPEPKLDHAAEYSRPYVYKLAVPELGMDCAVTGTLRVGIVRFTFAKDGLAWVSVQNNARVGDGALTIDAAKGEITGSNAARRLYAGVGQLAGFSGHVVVQFDHPFEPGGTWAGSDLHAGSMVQQATAAPSGGYVVFRVKAGETVTARVGTSFVSVDEARKNLQAEIPDWDFARVEAASHAAWDKQLGKIEITADEKDRRVFYTALYHASQLPRVFNDADGSYPRFADGHAVETARGFTYYDDYSAWDTFRALHPLLTIIDVERTRDMAQSLIVKGQQGGFLPIFPAWNSYTSEMIGDHAAVIITDAYIKGIRGFDIDEAYRLMCKNATELPTSMDEYRDGKGRRALDSYLKYGYVPLEDKVPDAMHKQEQVSRTLEYAYDDFVLAELAHKLGKAEDEATFRKRAANWRNVMDPVTGFARGRHADGSWVEPFDPTKPAAYITEGLPFQYTFFVPQDIAGLIAFEHGNQAFIAKLDALFAGKYYDHGNEPSHQITYLYNWAGAAWKTQAAVHAARSEWYKDKPDGLAGNDDAGQMSAWHVLSAMGFYQVTPGVPQYAIGSPMLAEAKIHLENGKTFRIVTHKDAEHAPYIQSAKLNGKPLNRFLLDYAEIMAGGLLEFEMSQKPNPAWPAK